MCVSRKADLQGEIGVEKRDLSNPLFERMIRT